MTDQQQASPEFDQGAGWRVLDPDGNVVSSGGVSIAQADGRLAGLIAAFATDPNCVHPDGVCTCGEPAGHEGEQDR